MKLKKIKPEFLKFLKEEKAHPDQIKAMDKLLGKYPNFEKDYIEAVKYLSNLYLNISHGLVIQHLRKSKNLLAKNNEAYKFADCLIGGIIPRFINFYHRDKLNLKFRFLPLTCKGKGRISYEQARALGEIE
jgi:hypothetical protein